MAVAVAFQRGDPEAVETVRRRVRKIVGFRGFGMPRHDKKDLEQEIMTQLWQAAARPGFDAGGRFWGFVEVVAGRRCIDWRRAQVARARETALDEELRESAAGPLRSTLDRERSDLVQAAIARLDASSRELVRLRLVEGRGYDELSQMLGKSAGALRVQMHRCVARLRRLVAPGPAVDEPEGESR